LVKNSNKTKKAKKKREKRRTREQKSGTEFWHFGTFFLPRPSPFFKLRCHRMRIELPHLLPFVVIFVNKSMTFHRQKFLLVSPSSIEFKYE
jgi:hypothetical protein